MPDERPPVDTDPHRLKVLDVGSLVGGPFVATVLGDLGAEIIKVEPPGGEFLRFVGGGESGYSFFWQSHSRNKRAVTLNLRTAEGQDLLRRLARWADILVENFRPGVMQRWGLGYDDLAAVNPRLVYVSVSGFGQNGPHRERPSYEFAAAAFGGLTFMTGFPDRPPVVPGLAIMDHSSALFATIGALEAVRRRDAAGEQGRGSWVDVGLYKPAIRMCNELITSCAATGRSHQREGSIPSGQTGPHVGYGSVYETSDGRHVSAFASTRAQFQRLLALLGRPELFDDPRFATEYDRLVTNVAVVDEVLRAWMRERPAADAVAALRDADVPVAPVQGPADILADEHVRERGNVVEIENVRGETVTIPGPLPHLSGDGAGIRWAAEEVGASNRDVFCGLLGLSDDAYAELVSGGVV